MNNVLGRPQLARSLPLPGEA